MPELFEGSQNTPSWLASGQRALERSVAQLIESSPHNPESVTSSGSADALRFASNLLQRHAVKSFREAEKK
jgi:hypothetical protein